MVVIGVIIAFASAAMGVTIAFHLAAGYFRPSARHRVMGRVELLRRIKVRWYESAPHHTRVERERYVWRVIVTFEDADGVTHAHGENLADEFAETLSMGDSCDVTYDDADPDHAATVAGKLRDRGTPRRAVAWIVGCAVATAAGVALALMG